MTNVTLLYVINQGMGFYQLCNLLFCVINVDISYLFSVFPSGKQIYFVAVTSPLDNRVSAHVLDLIKFLSEIRKHNMAGRGRIEGWLQPGAFCGGNSYEPTFWVEMAIWKIVKMHSVVSGYEGEEGVTKIIFWIIHSS